MKKFQELSKTDLKNTNVGIILGPVIFTPKIAKWLTGFFK